MSKIDYKIGEGNFSLVMKQIAEILLIEFNAQTLLGNTFLPETVSYDNSSAVNEGDLPFVSVNWMKFDNTVDNRETSQNLNDYFIDVKAKGHEDCRKIIAVIRTILKDQEYPTLGFDFGIVSKTNIVTAGIDFENMNKDSQDTISGGLLFHCNVVEDNPPREGVINDENNFELEIEDSEKTLKFIK